MNMKIQMQCMRLSFVLCLLVAISWGQGPTTKALA